MFAWRPARFLGPLRHPGCPALRQQVPLAVLRTHQDRMGGHGVVRHPQAGQTLQPLWGLLVGHPRSPWPPPASLGEPAAHGFRRSRDARVGLERRGACGPAPSRAAPARGPGGLWESGASGARPPGQADGPPSGDGALPVLVDPSAETPGAIRAHDTGHPGARATQARRHLRRVATRRTPQAERERQHRALPCAAADGAPLGLRCWGELPSGCGRHSEASLRRRCG